MGAGRFVGVFAEAFAFVIVVWVLVVLIEDVKCLEEEAAAGVDDDIERNGGAGGANGVVEAVSGVAAIVTVV